MNISRTLLQNLSAAFFLCVSLARADETSYAKILKERDSILSQIVLQREGRLAGGTIDDEALVAARLALWSFRRDTAPAKADKIRQQELIAVIFEKRLASQRNRAKAGIAGSEDVLLATDALLQAQQLLEELLLDAKSSEDSVRRQNQK